MKYVKPNCLECMHNTKINPLLSSTGSFVAIAMVGFDHESGEICKDGTDHWLICSSSLER